MGYRHISTYLAYILPIIAPQWLNSSIALPMVRCLSISFWKTFSTSSSLPILAQLLNFYQPSRHQIFSKCIWALNTPNGGRRIPPLLFATCHSMPQFHRSIPLKFRQSNRKCHWMPKPLGAASSAYSPPPASLSSNHNCAMHHWGATIIPDIRTTHLDIRILLLLALALANAFTPSHQPSKKKMKIKKLN